MVRGIDKKTGKIWETVCRGSFTVEASLLMPLVIAVFLFIIYLGFYLHDACVLRQNAYLISQKAGQISQRDAGQVRGRIQELVSTEAEHALLAAKVEGYSVEPGRDTIRVAIKGSMQFGRFGILKNIFQGRGGLEVSQETELARPVTFIRNCRKAVSLVEGLR